MGVPKFFRWATERYPAILSNTITNPSVDVPGIDNFYLDMNGIIHQCSHNNSSSLLLDLERTSFDSVFENIVLVLLNLVELIKPTQLLFIAIDGVAPRAKLNQQRARRFRSNKERERTIQEGIRKGTIMNKEDSFDSNCITPGTDFMAKLSAKLKTCIELEIATNDLWKQLQVCFSPSEVPGEGEHKIISYIRDTRAQAGYPPNVRHCIYGADADMIMLALATHEPFFLILRDAQVYTNYSGGKNRGKNKQQSFQSQKKEAEPVLTFAQECEAKKYQFIRIHVLREYLYQEFCDHSIYDYNNDKDDSSLPSVNKLKFADLGNLSDMERIIDDFVFLTFFVGNDFLPHIPGLDIGEGAFDAIFDAYKTVQVSDPTGYLVIGGDLDVRRLEVILSLLGATELVMYQERELDRAAQLERKIQQQKKRAALLAAKLSPIENRIEECTGPPEHLYNVLSNPPIEAKSNNNVDQRAEYYRNKLDIDLHDTSDLQELECIIQTYLEGLKWCLAYYSKGCISWSWFYPYHYGPFMQDMRDLERLSASIDFSLDQPLTSFQQLMGCLPGGSSNLLPVLSKNYPIPNDDLKHSGGYQWLMNDSNSPLISFYPKNFELDMNGKKHEWEAVIKIPFIDIHLLITCEQQYCPPEAFDPSDLLRNVRGENFVYSHVAVMGPLDTIRPFLTKSHVYFDVTNSVRIIAFEAGITAGQTFQPQIIPGTASFLEGYFQMDQLGVSEFLQPSTKAFKEPNNKKFGSNNISKQRSNYYNAQSAFPMPGETALTTSSSSNAESNANSAALDSKAWPSRFTQIFSCPMQVRIYLDDATNIFLLSLMNQLSLQIPMFESLVDVKIISHPSYQMDGSARIESFSLRLFLPHYLFSDDSNTKEIPYQFGVNFNKLEEYYGIMSDTILTKIGEIFPELNGKLDCVCIVDGDGWVLIRTSDNGDQLEQISQFICDKSSEFLQRCSNRFPTDVEHKNKVRENIHIPLPIAFAKQVVIGKFSGPDKKSFAIWLNEQLRNLAPHMPHFTCNTVDLLCPAVNSSMKIYNLLPK